MSEILRQTMNPLRRAACVIALGALSSACAGESVSNDTVIERQAEPKAVTENNKVNNVCDVLADKECTEAIMGSIHNEFIKNSGFDVSEIKVGAQVDHTKNPTEAGSASFTDKDLQVLDSPQEIAAFFNSDQERAKIARSRLENSLKDRPEELQRALKGEGYVPVQFMTPINVEGTTYTDGINVQKMTSTRKVDQAGDVFWIYLDRDGNIVKEASVRADCSNPEFDKIVPRRPGAPDAPGIDQPEEPPKKVVPIPEKVARPFTRIVPAYAAERGDGGEPEHGMDPENDRNSDGYGPGDREIADRDGDGIHNKIDNCPDQKETFNNHQDDDGCPDTAPQSPPPSQSPPTTGPPREEAPSTSPTTTVPEKRDETPAPPKD